MFLMWDITMESAGQERRKWRAGQNDSIKALAERVFLASEEAGYWLYSETLSKYVSHDSEIVDGHTYSVPNVLLSCNFLRPPGETRPVFIASGEGGQAASEITARHQGKMIHRIDYAKDLIQGIKDHRKDLWGLLIYGHGGQQGYVGDGSWNEGEYTTQDEILSLLSGTYRISWANLRECYSLAGTFKEKWECVALHTYGFIGINAAGIDLNNLWDPNAKLIPPTHGTKIR